MRVLRVPIFYFSRVKCPEMPLSPHITNLFSEYVALDTSRADGKHYGDVLDLLEPHLKKIGFTTTRVPIPETVAKAINRINLIAQLTVSKSAPTLLIYNHIDVVPANYPSAFKLTIKDGRAYGRGTSDHKGSTIAMLDALAKIDREKLRFNLLFLLTTDEETDQYAQLKYLEKYLEIDTTNTICFDPDTFAGGISVAHPGAWEFKITARGKAVHSAASHLGHNAIEALMALYPTLLYYKKTAEQQHSTIPSFPKDGKSQTVVSRCNINLVAGGSAANVIPDYAEMTIDTRFIPEMNVQEARKKLVATLATAFKKLAPTGVQYAVEDIAVLEGYTSRHPEFDVLENILTEVSGESGQFSVMGSTPLAGWAKELGVPHFGLGVARYESNMHGVDENCTIQDIETLSTVFARFVTTN